MIHLFKFAICKSLYNFNRARNRYRKRITIIRICWVDTCVNKDRNETNCRIMRERKSRKRQYHPQIVFTRLHFGVIIEIIPARYFLHWMCWVARENLPIVRNWDQDIAIGSLEQQGKKKDKEEASDKHGKARNLSIKSSTKARLKLGYDGRLAWGKERAEKRGVWQRMPVNVWDASTNEKETWLWAQESRKEDGLVKYIKDDGPTQNNCD